MITDSSQLTGHGKLFYQGIHCSQRDDAQSHAKEIVSKISLNTNITVIAKGFQIRVQNEPNDEVMFDCQEQSLSSRVHCSKEKTNKSRTVGIEQAASMSVDTFYTNDRGTMPLKTKQECIPGEFWNITTHFCDLCPKDTYQNTRGQTFCVQCPVGSSTDNHGSADINDCKRRICSSYIHDLQGFIESPNFPGEYPNNMECTWIMKPPRGRRLLFIVARVDLAEDKCQDFLVMRKNKSPYSVVTYEACKTSERPIAFTAQSRKLWIQFRSDSRNSSGGFHIPFVTYNGKVFSFPCHSSNYMELVF
uniref:CUB domain-containing protein n=1 Tax=Timema cristinae TaxID=61476 RepID=A0A7R9DLP3_TIMCR|nr:unnamed protein product [Timema cristinae]